MFRKIIGGFLKKHEWLRKYARKMNQKVRSRQYLRLAEKIEVEPKTILFESYMGRQYACSPRAIYEAMLQDSRFSDYQFVWAFTQPDAKRTLEPLKRAKLISYKTKEYYEYCAKAGIVITNSNMEYSICKKKGQIFVQTWHGTPLKRLRCDISAEHGNVNNTLEEIQWKNDMDVVRYDYFLSPSAFATEKFITAFRMRELGIEDIILETGYPRNDFLKRYTADDVEQMKNKLGISGIEKKIILYAPTFRDNQHESGTGYVYHTEVDFDKLQEALSDEYIILFRPHYFVANQFDFTKYQGFIYDVSEIDDVKELYIISDLLITDYSSVFFDYAILKRPILFYMYDLEEYADDIRGFYLDLKELPGPIIQNEEDLIRVIKTGNPDASLTYPNFNKKFNSLEDGNASRRVIERLSDA